MFFHPPALSPFLRPVCFSSLSDLPSCPAGSFPPCSPPAGPCAAEAVLLLACSEHHAGQAMPIARLLGAGTLPPAIVGAQKCFQRELFEKSEQTFAESSKICKSFSSRWLPERGTSPLFRKSYKRLIWKITGGSSSWVFSSSLLPFFHLAPKKKKGNYKRFLKD